MNTMSNVENPFVVTAFWEAAPGEEDAVAAILSRFAPRAREEPGVVNFVIHRIAFRAFEVLLLRGRSRTMLRSRPISRPRISRADRR